MAAAVLAADTSPTVALVVAIIALVGSIMTAAFTWLSAQRERETKFQAERRELYSQLLTTLRTGRRVSGPEGPVEYPLLVERVRQVSPEIREYIDRSLPDPLARIDDAALGGLREAMDYQQKPWASRRVRDLLRRMGLGPTPEWLQ